MKLQDFQFDLPFELIAKYPAAQRSHSRLLHCHTSSANAPSATSQLADYHFHQLTNLLNPGDLLILNDTKVIPARLFGHKSTGGKVEILMDRLLDENKILAYIRSSKSPKPGSKIQLPGEAIATVEKRVGELFQLVMSTQQPLMQYLETHGHVPLPPYLEREDEALDRQRYQTVFSRVPGAVAAPTAGLHFDDELLQQLTDFGVQTAYVTLHVGAGTFAPVRCENITEHNIHSEYMELDEHTCQQVQAARANGKRVIAVGTTAVRCLETAARDGQIQAYQGDTDIFIYPGFQFQCVDAMITNFHLPGSSLLMLVSAFAGLAQIKAAYQYAIAEQYRFYSYGDAMLLTRD